MKRNILLENALKQIGKEDDFLNAEKRKGIDSIVKFFTKCYEDYYKFEGEEKRKTKEILDEQISIVFSSFNDILKRGTNSLILRIDKTLNDEYSNLLEQYDKTSDDPSKKMVQENVMAIVTTMIKSVKDKISIIEEKSKEADEKYRELRERQPLRTIYGITSQRKLFWKTYRQSSFASV